MWAGRESQHCLCCWVAMGALSGVGESVLTWNYFLGGRRRKRGCYDRLIVQLSCLWYLASIIQKDLGLCAWHCIDWKDKVYVSQQGWYRNILWSSFCLGIYEWLVTQNGSFLSQPLVSFCPKGPLRPEAAHVWALDFPWLPGDEFPEMLGLHRNKLVDTKVVYWVMLSIEATL